MNWIEADHSVSVESAACAKGSFVSTSRIPCAPPHTRRSVRLGAESPTFTLPSATPSPFRAFSCFSWTPACGRSTKDTKGHERGAGDSQECDSEGENGLWLSHFIHRHLAGLYRNPQNRNLQLSKAIVSFHTSNLQLPKQIVNPHNYNLQLPKPIVNPHNCNLQLPKQIVSPHNRNLQLPGASVNLHRSIWQLPEASVNSPTASIQRGLPFS